MKILSMTATFGKLSHQTLTFKPGLNVIHAPNEWGKSTWCAFLVAMLYGIDTRERTTQAALADKERYTPWSGEPMSGRIELLWNDRHITIERTTKGRRIFGVFQAYETQSGLPVPELTADNCGQMLLGVEKNVFTRAGFIRLTDLPVTQDEALRRRLNALVTTGDESGTGDKLAQTLKDLKNRCRHNKTGLLPQAEAQRATFRQKLEQLRTLQDQTVQLTNRSAALEDQIRALENHRDALAYEAALADIRRVAQAKEAAKAAEEKAAALEERCRPLPTSAEAKSTLEQLAQLQESLNELRDRPMPQLPDPPAQKAPFHGLDVQQAQAMLQADLYQYAGLKNKKQYLPYILIALAGFILTCVLLLAVPQAQGYAYLPLILGGLALIIKRIPHITDRQQCIALEAKYGSTNTALWQAMAQSHMDTLQTHADAMAAYDAQRNDYQDRQAQLQQQMLDLTQGAPVTAARQYWEQVQASHRELDAARSAHQQALDHAIMMESMLRQATPPRFPDEMTLSSAETDRALTDAAAQRVHLQSLLGQAQGQTALIGSEEQLQQELDAVECRIEKLEDIHDALSIAMQTLEAAKNELQRRFAPRLSQRAQELFSRLTGGRYDRLQLTRDLNVNAGAQGENALQSALWRSEGTVDQLYLALRLAVAEELTPDAPLVLDDALVRFDDERLRNAMTILSEAAENKQVLLFTCQNRETQYLSN